MNELLIKELYDKGNSIYSLAKDFGVDKKTIKKIVEKGKYYINITTGEMIFTSKKISYEEQLYNHIMYKDIETNGNFTSQRKSDFLIRKSINSRLAVYLKVDLRQTNRWGKKELRLFGCKDNGEANVELMMGALEFILNEESLFKENAYYIDKRGMVKGYKLWYVTVSSEWLFYLRKYIYDFIEWKKTNEDNMLFYEYTKSKYRDKYCYINTRVAIQYGKRMMKYNYDIEETPNIFYLEQEAYWRGILKNEYKEMVEKYIDIC